MKKMLSLFLILTVAALLLSSCRPDVDEICDNLLTSKRADQAKTLREMVINEKQDKETKEKALGCLVQALGVEEDRVRSAAYSELDENILDVDTKTSVPILKAGLNDQSKPKKQEYSAKLLGKLGEKAVEAVHDLAGLLSVPVSDTKKAVAKAAAGALGDIGPAAIDAVDELILVLSDKDVSSKAREALKDIIRDSALDAGVKHLDNALKEYDKDDTGILLGVMDVIAYLGPRADKTVSNLAVILKDGAAPARKKAAIALGEIGPAAIGAVDELILALGDKDVASEALVALEAILDETAPDAGVEHLDNALVEYAKDDTGILLGVMDVIAYLGPKADRTVSNLAVILKDGAAPARNKAAIALGEIGPAAIGAVDKLILALGDKDVRQEAFDALKKIIVEPNIPDGVARLDDTAKEVGNDPQVRIGAIRLLGYLGPSASKAIDTLTIILLDAEGLEKTTDIRAEAALALGQIGGDQEEAVQTLTSVLTEKTGEFQYQYGTEIRYKAAEGLAYVNQETVDIALEGLIPALADDEVTVRATAETTVRGFITYEYDKENDVYLIDPEVANSTIQALVQAPALDNAGVTAIAAKLLKSIEPPRDGYVDVVDYAAEALTSALWDDRRLVSDAAKASLMDAELSIALRKASALLLHENFDRSEDEDKLIKDVLSAMGKDIIPELLVGEKVVGEKYSSTLEELLGKIPGITGQLIAIMKAEDEIHDVRLLAAEMLGKLAKDPDEAIPALGEVSKTGPTIELQESAVNALIMFAESGHGKAALSQLLALYTACEPTPWDPEHARDKLVVYIESKGTNALVQMLTSADESASTRAAAAAILVEFMVQTDTEDCDLAGELVVAYKSVTDVKEALECQTDTTSLEELKAWFGCPFIDEEASEGP